MKQITCIGVMVVVSAGCLPRGAPPAGRLIVADRQASLGAMVPPNGDGILRVVFMRPSATDSAGSDLYVVSVDPSGEVSPERLLIRDVNTEEDLGCLWKVAPCSFDDRGRLSVYTNEPAQPGMFAGPTWVDPVTGELTQSKDFIGGCSQSGTRCFSVDPAGTTGTLTEANGQTTTLQLGASPGGVPAEHYFFGEDFYYIDSSNNLIDVPPSDVPQQLAAGVINFNVWPTPDGPLLTLTGPSSDPTMQPLSLRDPVTGTVTLLPFAGQGSFSFSSDYRWLLYSLHSFDDVTMTLASTYTLYDRSSGTTQALGFPQAFMQWRPGSDQLWAVPPGNDPMQMIWILTPGAPTITVPGVRLEGFSKNGAYWFSTTDDPNKANPTLQVGLADDPNGPRFPYSPPGTWIENEWDLPDGRLMIEDYTNNVQRADTMIIDPRTGDSKVLAERGHVAALGQTRVMGMYRYDGGRGDLTTVELDTGRSTVLAPEFTVTAFAEPQGTDLLAPGARVVYQFQARTASPYDGLWLVNSP